MLAGADLVNVTIQIEFADEAPMRLLANGLPLSLLWDLVDPAGPASEDLLRYEG
jgi:hypothetical protein